LFDIVAYIKTLFAQIV